MRCPNRKCRRQTARQVAWSDKKGKCHWGCASCIWMFRPESKTVNVRTGRKIWAAYEVYGQKKTMEKNQNWIEKVTERAAKSRKETGYVSEGTYNFMQDHYKRGLMRPRENGRPVR